MSRIPSEIEMLMSFIGKDTNKEEINIVNHHEEILQKALKEASEWSEILGRRIRGKYEKHWIKIKKVQERATYILAEANEMKLNETIKYFVEEDKHHKELYLLKKYYDFVVELETRKTYDYITVSKYSFELGKKLNSVVDTKNKFIQKEGESH